MDGIREGWKGGRRNGRRVGRTDEGANRGKDA